MDESQSLSTHKNTKIVVVTTHMHKLFIVEPIDTALAIVLQNKGTNKVGGRNCNFGAANQLRQRRQMVRLHQIKSHRIFPSENSNRFLKSCDRFKGD